MVTVVIIISFSAGLLVDNYFLHPPDQDSELHHRSQGYQFINPLLECRFSNLDAQQSLLHLKNTVSAMVSQQINSKDVNYVALYFRNLNNGPWFGIHEKTLFSPASLVKVPLMITYYKIADSDPAILTQTITVGTTTAYQDQNFLPPVKLEINHSYTVDELIRRMTVYSDNQAYNLLINHIDNNLVIKSYTDLDIDISKGFTDPTGNIISVQDYAAFFRILYNSSYLSQDLSEKALKLLSQVEFKDGLVAGVPNNVIVSHKYGEREYTATGEKQFHDCGIVYYPRSPYLLCIMTRAKDFPSAIKAIKLLSQAVHTAISLQK